LNLRPTDYESARGRFADLRVSLNIRSDLRVRLPALTRHFPSFHDPLRPGCGLGHHPRAMEHTKHGFPWIDLLPMLVTAGSLLVAAVPWLRNRELADDLYRSYNQDTDEHQYTTEPMPAGEGWVQEGIICRVLRNGGPDRVQLSRQDHPGVAAGRSPARRRQGPDHVLAVNDNLRTRFTESGYEPLTDLGFVYTAQQGARSVPIFELSSHGPERHFYTNDVDEAHRVRQQGNYDLGPTLICHALPPPLTPKTKRAIWSFVWIVFGLVFIGSWFGDGSNPLQRLASSWGLVAGVAAVAAGYLLGVAIGQRPRS
jgi:hypothetical protein